ncbi:MAG: oligosaccharide flippase family protein [Eggerthellaceae bacterium]|nr:oligosaccharide flippase family protein [Eggerthellaceae bacterium]CCY05105.1 membrane protein involved in the export of O-antigen and teichoic acid [Eggerthella sp. CAG:1427]
MKTKYQTLVKNLGLFALSGFIPKAISFFLVPLYTSILSTSEYGIADLISTTVLLLIPLFTAQVQDAVLRFTLDKSYDNKTVFSVGIKTVCLGTVLVGGGCCLVCLSGLFPIEPEYLFFTGFTFAVMAFYNVLTLFCRGIDRVGLVAVGSIIHSVLTLILNIVFLVVIRLGLTGYLMANSLGTLVSVLYIVAYGRLWHYFTFKTSWAIVGEMLKYSLPLIFSVIAWWVNSASNRYVLTAMVGLSASGLYAIAYKIPSVLSIFGNVFSQAWSISAIKEYDPKDSDGFFGKMFTFMSFGMVVTCSLVMIFNIPLASILYSNEFFDAWCYVPFLLVAVVFDILCQFIGGVFTAVKDTKVLAVTTISGAFVNLIACLSLVPLVGIIGAAISAVLGYAVVLILRLIMVRKHISMKVKWWKTVVIFSLLITQMTISVFGLESIKWQLIILLMIVLLNTESLNQIIRLARKAIPVKWG